MGFLYAVPGVCLLLIAIYFAATWRQQAAWVRRWYWMMSEEDGRPWWRRGHFRPNERQAIIVTWLFITLAAAMAVYLILDGLSQ
jgi:hypothetical protein